MEQMRERKELAQIALFIDVENFAGTCLGLGLPIDLAPAIEKLTEFGRVTIRRSFGDMHKIPMALEQKKEMRKMLQRQLVQHEDVPYHSNFKNSADMRIAIEALTVVYTNPAIDIVAVVSADKDFLPLFAKIREIGKQVICIGGSRDNTAEVSIHSCDYFFYHELLAAKNAKFAEEPAAPAGQPSPVPASDASPADDDAASRERGEEACQLLLDALKSMTGAGSEIANAAALGTMMRRMRPDFEPAAYGFPTFKALCQHVERLGRISMWRNGDTLCIQANHDEADGAAAGDTAVEPSGVLLKRWVETKLKVTLPGQEARQVFYRELASFDELGEGRGLQELSQMISLRARHSELGKAACYKLLYSLFRAKTFLCRVADDTYNPTVLDLRVTPEVAEKLDDLLLMNLIRQYVREKAGEFNPADWSLLFYGSADRAEKVAEIEQAI